jgi:hypothetical protein
MFNTQPCTGVEIYCLFADLTQNRGGHNFEHNGEVRTSVKIGGKSLFLGTIYTYVLEDNMCEGREISKQLI